MSVNNVISLLLVLCFRLSVSIIREFSLCHDDFGWDPPDGVLKRHTFTWLGFAQYVHITSGHPFYLTAPRVILIHKQFVLTTAKDVLHLPTNHKIGYVVFGEYARDEDDCGLTRPQIKMGIKCPPAYIEIPVVDTITHPEYSRFGVSNSLALVKLLRPLKSQYMVPVCMPTITERSKKRKNKAVMLIDYMTTVPFDFNSEKMAKKTLQLYTHRDCRRHRMRARLGNEGLTNLLCTTGCGVRPGAPIISHNADGPYELIGIAIGGSTCHRRAMRRRLNVEPPLYIDVYPYVAWIINVVTAHHLPQSYPQNFMLTDSGGGMGVNKGYFRKEKSVKSAWKARTFMAGNYCFGKSKKRRKDAVLFYSERFEVTSQPPTKLNVVMKISAGIQCTIVCARILLPNRLSRPNIEGIGGFNISITFSTEWLPYTFYFSLALDGKNSSISNMEKWSDMLAHRKTRSLKPYN